MLVSEAEPLFLAIPISVFSFCAKSVNVDGAELFAFLKLDLWLKGKKKRMITVTAARANRYVNKQRTIAVHCVLSEEQSLSFFTGAVVIEFFFFSIRLSHERNLRASFFFFSFHPLLRSCTASLLAWFAVCSWFIYFFFFLCCSASVLFFLI